MRESPWHTPERVCCAQSRLSDAMPSLLTGQVVRCLYNDVKDMEREVFRRCHPSPGDAQLFRAFLLQRRSCGRCTSRGRAVDDTIYLTPQEYAPEPVVHQTRGPWSIRTQHQRKRGISGHHPKRRACPLGRHGGYVGRTSRGGRSGRRLGVPSSPSDHMPYCGRLPCSGPSRFCRLIAHDTWSCQEWRVEWRRVAYTTGFFLA